MAQTWRGNRLVKFIFGVTKTCFRHAEDKFMECILEANSLSALPKDTSELASLQAYLHIIPF